MKTDGNISWNFSQSTDTGFSSGEYGSLNLADHTGDHRNSVLKNRKSYAELFGIIEMKMIFMNQVHGSTIEYISDVSDLGDNLVCDGMFTHQKGIVLNVMVADCVPIILYDKKLGIIGVVHAGWKPTSLKILQKMIASFVIKGSDVEDIYITMGPSIQQGSYEVDDMVVKHFDEEVYIDKGEGKYMLNLQCANKLQAIQVGILEENIAMNNIDTYTDINYFSARRQGLKSGRFCGSIILN